MPLRTEMNSGERLRQFENRKADHIRLSLDPRNQAEGATGFDQVALIHEALPDLDFKQIKLNQDSLGQRSATPFLLSSMTAGHRDSGALNLRLAMAAENFGWRMGVGSQRRELSDPEAIQEWRQLRQSAKRVVLYGNLGLSQLIKTKTEAVQRLAETLQASAMIIHLNALQECLQPEGTPEFRGGLKAIQRLAKGLPIPVIVKETGCGFSRATLKRLRHSGLGAVDVSGYGGTHWGRIEGDRNEAKDLRSQAALTMAEWGISTLDSLAAAVSMKRDFEVWASGGIRTGLDAAKALAMGANMVGFAMPILAAAMEGDEALHRKMELLALELKIAMFCTGCKSINELQQKKVWKWREL